MRSKWDSGTRKTGFSFPIIVAFVPRLSWHIIVFHQSTEKSEAFAHRNFGEQTGRYLGVVLLSLLGGVEPPLFENIELLVLIRSLLSAAPLLIITAMIPVGSPREDAEYYAEAQTVEEQEEEENPNESADGCAQREERERIVRSP